MEPSVRDRLIIPNAERIAKPGAANHIPLTSRLYEKTHAVVRKNADGRRDIFHRLHFIRVTDHGTK